MMATLALPKKDTWQEQMHKTLPAAAQGRFQVALPAKIRT